jgi:hypothetical protein
VIYGAADSGLTSDRRGGFRAAGVDGDIFFPLRMVTLRVCIVFVGDVRGVCCGRVNLVIGDVVGGMRVPRRTNYCPPTAL